MNITYMHIQTQYMGWALTNNGMCTHFLADNSGIIRDERWEVLAGPTTWIVLQNTKPGSVDWAGREVEAEHGPRRRAASRR
jgi:hypothetical protein